MRNRRRNRTLRETLSAIRRLFRRRKLDTPGGPDDPYAYVMAPKKPRLPGRGAAAVVEEPD